VEDALVGAGEAVEGAGVDVSDLEVAEEGVTDTVFASKVSAPDRLNAWNRISWPADPVVKGHARRAATAAERMLLIAGDARALPTR
jgi:hypothetical protein